MATNMDAYLPDLKIMINDKFNNPTAFIKVSQLLKTTGSVLAGGSVLQVISKYKAPTRLDLDFYCPTKNIPNFINGLTMPLNLDRPIFDKCNMTKQAASFYCASFLRKNGVRKIYRLSRIDDSPEAKTVHRTRRPREFAQMIDIMSVRNARKVTDVVQNFDLTFCQVWYDGTNIWSTHPEDIKNKTGILQKDYSNLFIKGNAFLKKRVQKYKDRGFKITLDPHAPVVSVETILNNESCINPTGSKNRSEDPEFMNRWATRIIMKWILGVRNNPRDFLIRQETKIEIANSDINLNNILIVPPKEHNFNNENNFLPNQQGNILKTPGSRSSSPIILEADDGYDSEDYTTLTSLKQLATMKKINRPNNLAELKSADLYYYRMANDLLKVALYPLVLNGPTLGYMLEKGVYKEKLVPYKDVFINLCTRKGECYIMKSDDETVYDIHDHPLEGAISQDGMEGHLTSHIRDVDKMTVPCYYKPEPPTAGNPNPKGNCSKPISLSEVKMIVSDDFWAKYSAPIPIKTGLSESISTWDTTLTNVKQTDEQFGDIFTKSICPYCLQFAERDGGCAYIGHENPKGLDSSHYPYCQKEFVVQELVDLYRASAEAIDPEIPVHLEWCVECGRPSVGHEHFDTKSPVGKEIPPKKRDPNNPNVMIYDYGKCAGGGRAELFARILAIRRVYRDLNIKDPKEERRSAALAADAAPNDPELMEQGRKIAAQELAMRKWGNAPIPENKIYNNTNDSNIEDASNRSNNNNNNNNRGNGLNLANLQGGKKTRKRKTQNKRRQSRRR